MCDRTWALRMEGSQRRHGRLQLAATRRDSLKTRLGTSYCVGRAARVILGPARNPIRARAVAVIAGSSVRSLFSLATPPAPPTSAPFPRYGLVRRLKPGRQMTAEFSSPTLASCQKTQHQIPPWPWPSEKKLLCQALISYNFTEYSSRVGIANGWVEQDLGRGASPSCHDDVFCAHVNASCQRSIMIVPLVGSRGPMPKFKRISSCITARPLADTRTHARSRARTAGGFKRPAVET